MRGFGRGCRRGNGRGLGRFRDGSGPNPDCPFKNANRDIQEQRGKLGRTLKRDGSGPNRDGRGPRGSNLGPRNGCPNK